ncbi:MAG: hypothetical protein MRZ79_20410 [Bacteroidia bacterium]|nr:hypothetical protein [Bacteroidia bacterium]
MEPQKIKSLRKKLSISLKEAIELLKKHNGNIEASEEEFHDKKINEICKATECDKDKAKKSYEKFNFNTEKAIKEINNEQKILTIGNQRIAKNSIGFVLWFEDDKGEPFKNKKRNDIFIPTEDFDFIKEEFESNCSENFDITFNNYFDRNECKLILKALEKKNSKTQNQEKFLNDLKEWMNENLKFVGTLVVYGNL